MSEADRMLTALLDKWVAANKVPPHQPPPTIGEYKILRPKVQYRPPSRESMLAVHHKGEVTEECHSCHHWFVSSYLKIGWIKDEAWPKPPLPTCRECVTVYKYQNQWRPKSG
jgi:hypothetical protein